VTHAEAVAKLADARELAEKGSANAKSISLDLYTRAVDAYGEEIGRAISDASFNLQCHRQHHRTGNDDMASCGRCKDD
jgi:hypothetical protein